MNIDATLYFDLILLSIHINQSSTKELADELFELFEENVQSLPSKDVAYVNVYISIIKEVLNNRLNVDDNKADILNIIIKYTNNRVFSRDKIIKSSLLDLVESNTKADRLAMITERLNNVVVWFKSNSYINKIYGNLKECKLAYDVTDQTEKINDLKDLVGSFKSTLLEIDSAVGKNGPVEVIDFSKKNSIKEALGTFKDRSITHVLKTGLQGLNKMLGKAGGFQLGESVIFCALLHNFKSGILMNIARWIVDHNEPPKVKGKKPLILMITLENLGYMNMMSMFRQMYFTLTGSSADSLSDTDTTNYIYEYFNRAGYTFIIERYLPSSFGYDEYVHLCERYSAAGYNLVGVLVDYIEKMKKTDGKFSREGNYVLIDNLFNQMCNYNKAIGSSLFSGAQLNRGAADLVASGMPHPVKQFSERHLAGSIGIGREVDFLCYMHIEQNDAGESWLTFQWGKHRYDEDTPEKDKFTAYRFEPNGIPDDCNGKNAGSKDIYAVDKAKNKETNQQSIEELLGF